MPGWSAGDVCFFSVLEVFIVLQFFTPAIKRCCARSPCLNATALAFASETQNPPYLARKRGCNALPREMRQGRGGSWSHFTLKLFCRLRRQKPHAGLAHETCAVKRVAGIKL